LLLAPLAALPEAELRKAEIESLLGEGVPNGLHLAVQEQ